jgi:hypothetical protein
MYQIWYVTVFLEDGTSFERSYVALTSSEALKKAETEYPSWISLGASRNPSEDWNVE